MVNARLAATDEPRRVDPCARANCAAGSYGETASVKLLKMMDRAVATPDAEAVCGSDRSADPGLGVAHSGFHAFALRQPRGNRRGERAAGAVGIFCGDARRGERGDARGIDQIVDALGALPVAALDQHRLAPQGQQSLALLLDGGFV